MMLVAGAMACGLAACSDDDTTPSGNITPRGSALPAAQ